MMKKLITGDALIDFARQISSKEAFNLFLQCSLQDYVDNRDEWESTDLLGYLIGLSGFVSDMEGYYHNSDWLAPLFNLNKS